MKIQPKKLVKLLRSSEKTDGEYNPANLLITLHSKGEPFSEKEKAVFIHEFTHYMQNVATVYGATHMLDLFEFMLKTFSKLGSSKTDPVIPLKNDTNLKSTCFVDQIDDILASDSYGLDYDKNNENYIFKTTNNKDFTIYKESIDITQCLPEIYWIAYQGKGIPLNALLFQENMAFVNEILANLSGQCYSNEKAEGFLVENKTEQCYIYIVILDFVDYFFPKNNVLKLSFLICEAILNCIPIEKDIISDSIAVPSSAHVILSYLKEKASQLNGVKEEDIIYRSMKDTGLESISYSELGEWRKREKKFEESLQRQNNPFTKMMIEFMNCVKHGLSYREKGMSLYSKEFTKGYLQPLMQNIGAPLIFFDKAPKICSINEYVPQRYKEIFEYIYGSLEVFFQIYDGTIEQCPFLKMNICKHDKNTNCKKGCLANWNLGESWICHLINCLLCTGIRSSER